MAARAAWLGGGAMALLALSPAEAQAFDPEPHLGVELGLAWHDGLKLTAGLSLRTANLFGPVARIEVLGLTAARMTLGAHYSAVFGDNRYLAQLIGAEAGVGALVPLAAPRDFALGFHGAAGLDVGVGGAWLRTWGPFDPARTGWVPSLAVDLTPTRYTWGVEGRPLRHGADFVQAPVFSGLPSSQPLRREEEALKATASDSAAAEAASIPSFLRLAAELAEADAPADLVRRARGAACEEVNHAELALVETQRWARSPQLVPVLRAQPRPSSTRREALSRLASESWLDGCLNEGVAAAHAAASARLATDPEVQRTRRRIAHDEAGHAELAWDVLEWAMREGPPAVRDRVAASIDQSPEPVPADDASLDVEWLERHGRVSAKTRANVTEAQLTASRKRLKRLLDRVS